MGSIFLKIFRMGWVQCFFSLLVKAQKAYTEGIKNQRNRIPFPQVYSSFIELNIRYASALIRINLCCTKGYLTPNGGKLALSKTVTSEL